MERVILHARSAWTKKHIRTTMTVSSERRKIHANIADYLQLILTMIRPLAKQKGITERGNHYTLVQDAPNRIHVTLQNGDYAIYDSFENLRSEEEMMERRNLLENEFMEWIASRKQLTESTNEAND